MTEALRLPGSIVGLRQIRQCIRELESIEDQLVNETVKAKAGVSDKPHSVAVPRMIEELVTYNKHSLANKKDVQELKERLETFSQHAPRLKFIFSSEPEDAFLVKLVSWLREHINLYVLVEVSISPYIAGGFVLQTPTRRYDLSWRQRFEAQGDRITRILRQGDGKTANGQ